MARLNRRSDGGYFVTNTFTRAGISKHTTYQAEPRALEILAAHGLSSGDEIPKQLFFELLEEELLLTGKSGPGVEIASHGSPHPVKTESAGPTYRRIPLDVTPELLNEDGFFISFGAFKLRYGDDSRLTEDDLRRSYRELYRKYELDLQQEFQRIASTHRATSIRRKGDRIIVELLSGGPQHTSDASDSDYAIRHAEQKERLRRQSLRTRIDPMDKPGKSGGYQPGW